MHTPEEFTLVERMARIVSSVHGVKPDYKCLATELEQAIPFDVLGIVLLRHDRQAIRVTICYRNDGAQSLQNSSFLYRTTDRQVEAFVLSQCGIQDRWLEHYRQCPLQGSMLEHILNSTTVVVKEYPHGLDGLPGASGDALSGFHQLHSMCIVPLCIEERLLGTLELGSITSNVYSKPPAQRFIKAVAQVLAATIEGAQLSGSAEIQNRQRQALKDISNALASKMNLSTILTNIVSGVAKALNVASFIAIYNQQTCRLRLEAQAGLDSLAFEKFKSNENVLTDQSIIGKTLRHRQSYLSNDIMVDERFPASRLIATEFGIRSVLCYPLVTGTTIYGTLLLCSAEPGGFTPLKADILALFANQAIIAIHNEEFQIRASANVGTAENSSETLASKDGYICMDRARRQVHVGGQEVRLTPTEFEILHQLLLYAGKVLTHRSLLQAVWGPKYGEEADYLRVYIRQLRRKVEADPSRPKYILTDPGIGDVFRSPTEF